MDRPKKEEFTNGLTHAIGTALSLAAAFFLMREVVPQGNWPKTIACLAYSVSLVAVYFSSTMSHWEPNVDRKIFYRRLDQAFIYLLIVASFTPFCIVFLRKPYFSFLLIVMWLIAVGGFVSKLWAAHRIQGVAIWIYLALGWMTLLAFIPWLIGMQTESTFPRNCFAMILLGGVFYSVGTIFLYLDHKAWPFHAIWHCFVMLGSITHFWAMMKYVA